MDSGIEMQMPDYIMALEQKVAQQAVELCRLNGAIYSIMRGSSDGQVEVQDDGTEQVETPDDDGSGAVDTTRFGD